MMLLSSAHAEMTTLPKVDTKCTTPSLIPTVNGNTVLSFSTHGQQSAANGSLTTVSRSDIRLIQHLDSSALGFGPEVALNWLFPYPILPPTPGAKKNKRNGAVSEPGEMRCPLSGASSLGCAPPLMHVPEADM
jgi:hypothetical protein